MRLLNQAITLHKMDTLMHSSQSTSPSLMYRHGQSQHDGYELSSKLDEVLEKVGVLSQQVAQIKAESDGDAVKFFSLGFREPKEAEAWVESHLATVSYGVVVDAHMVLEHIHSYVVDSDNSLQHLQSLHKLKIDNITQGLAISSFDTRLPKLLSKSTSLAGAIGRRGAMSHFDQIPSYKKEWDEPGCGFRERLKEELINFEFIHTKVIEGGLSPDSKAFGIAKLSVTESESWILQLIMFIDNTYKDLIRQNTFAADKAWQLTTQLGRRIFMEVTVPRSGVQNLFQIGDNVTIAKQILWPIVKSHDVMKRYKEASFKDDVTVASEYVKFLAANSGNEMVDKLVTRFGAVEADIKAFSKTAASVEKSNGQAMYKLDEVNKRLTEMQKRISKLEGGKN
jgi:hypothetical protein